MRNTLRTLCCAAFMVGGAADAQATLPPSCDAKLANAAPGRDANRYRVRGDAAGWCEGVFARQEVGNVELKLQGFTVTIDPITSGALARTDTLLVQWNAPPGMIVHILARQGIDPFADYYQLDVERVTPASGVGTWQWPTAVLKYARMWPVAMTDQAMGDIPPAISVQAVGRTGTADKPDSIYIPVRITPVRAAAVPRRLEITMTAKERVTVRVPRLFRLADDGTTTAIAIARGCPAITGGVVGGDPVTIPICMPSDAKSGMYVVAIGATADAAMIRAQGIRFYYGAPTP